MTSSATIDQLATLVRACGYKAEEFRGSPTIRTGIGGFQVYLIMAVEGQLQFRASYSLTANAWSLLLTINEFNRDWRFSKLYVDQKGDLVMSSDGLFEPSKHDAFDTLKTLLEMFEQSLANLKEKFAPIVS